MIVMTETALRLLVGCGACPEEKVRVVPHGAPTRLTARAASGLDAAAPRRRRRGERFLLSTFGLISPGKGLETVIEALPAIVERHPEVVYTIAGRTHPDVARREGERYRLMLERRVLELGLGEHVEFDDRFLSIDELADLLAATDVFVTPYRNREQIASGALTFAIAAGCGVVSTPYWYAQDMLASGAGRLVPFDDPAALADAVCALHRAAGDARRRARRGAPDRRVARLARRSPRRPRRCSARRTRSRPGDGPRAPPTCTSTSLRTRPPAHARRRRRHRAARARDHPQPRQRLLRRRRRPARRRLARARPPRRRAGLDVDPLPRARVPARGHRRDGMRNFMGYDRRWLDEPHVGDHVGRSVWALGEILATAWIPAVVVPARDLLERLVGALAGEVPLRTAAYTVLGLARLDADRLEPAAQAAARAPGRPARRRLRRSTASDDWRWFEDAAQLRQRTTLAGADRRRRGARPGRPRRARARVAALARRRVAASATDSCASPGHRGRRRGRARAGHGRRAAARRRRPRRGRAGRLRRHRTTPSTGSGRRARSSGSSAATACSSPLYDFATGGCSDGLGSEALNENEGAESTLAFHRAALLLDAAGVRADIRRARASRPVAA